MFVNYSPRYLLFFREFWGGQEQNEVGHQCCLQDTTFNTLSLQMWSFFFNYCETYLRTFSRTFAKTISRPFELHYNPYTQSVDIVKDLESIACILRDIQHDLGIAEHALSRKTLKWEPAGDQKRNALSWMSKQNINYDFCCLNHPNINKRIVKLYWCYALQVSCTSCLAWLTSFNMWSLLIVAYFWSSKGRHLMAISISIPG